MDRVGDVAAVLALCVFVAHFTQLDIYAGLR
jgi:hypothetical protein